MGYISRLRRATGVRKRELLRISPINQPVPNICGICHKRIWPWEKKTFRIKPKRIPKSNKGLLRYAKNKRFLTPCHVKCMTKKCSV